MLFRRARGDEESAAFFGSCEREIPRYARNDNQAAECNMLHFGAVRGMGLRIVCSTSLSYLRDYSHLVSMGLECLPGLKQRLQAGKNTWPSIGAGSVSGVILGPLVMRHRYFCGFGLGHQFDSCA